MLKSLKLIWAVLCLYLLAVAPAYPAFAGPSTQDIPGGFRLILEGTGVQLFRKNYPNGTPDFVQVVDLNQGAAFVPLHGTITEDQAGKGVFGGNDARFRSRTLHQYWDSVSNSAVNAFCVFNGQFFYMPEYPTRLPFSLKKNGVVLTDGFGKNDHPGQQLILELWPDHADIQPLSAESLYASTAPDIIGGLTEDANKRAKRSVARTFVAVDDRDANGIFETILIFNTRSALQTEAAKVLRSFGADKIMMLDGGGSTQLLCEGESFIFSERIIPQAIAVLAGNGSPRPPVEAPVAPPAALSGDVEAQPQAPESDPYPAPETSPETAPYPAPESAAEQSPPETDSQQPIQPEDGAETQPAVVESPPAGSVPADPAAGDIAVEPAPAAGAAYAHPGNLPAIGSSLFDSVQAGVSVIAEATLEQSAETPVQEAVSEQRVTQEVTVQDAAVQDTPASEQVDAAAPAPTAPVEDESSLPAGIQPQAGSSQAAVPDSAAVHPLLVSPPQDPAAQSAPGSEIVSPPASSQPGSAPPAGTPVAMAPLSESAFPSGENGLDISPVPVVDNRRAEMAILAFEPGAGLSGVILIPVAILPVSAILLMAITRIRRRF